MVLRKLKLRRFRTKESNLGYFSFGVRIRDKDFIYLKSNPDGDGDIERWNNNFYGAYRVGESRNHVLLSIEGISLFDSSWGRRRNIHLDRKSNEYQELRRLAKNGKFKDLETHIHSLIGKHKV